MFRALKPRVCLGGLLLAGTVAGFALWVPSLWVGEAQAQVLPGSGGVARADIRNTRHNLSPSRPTRQATSGNTTTTEDTVRENAVVGEVCVYCHTPHGTTQIADQPLWNRQSPGTSATPTTYVASYTPYASSTLNAGDVDVSIATLGNPSKLCLSCHDGSIAIGQVANAPGSGGTATDNPRAINMTGFGTTAPTTPAGSMPFGRNLANADHGFTRRLGTDLRNDHPISSTYSGAVGTTLATNDKELRDPAGSTSPTMIANRTPGVKPDFPLSGGRVQCSTCHEPHRNTQKFLVKNRMVQGVSAQAAYNNWTFSDANDQICMGCHTRLGLAWQQSAHASQAVANETYKAPDAAVRDFPTGTAVWQAGCLNCHDTHTVAGSRRLLREGVNSALVTPAGTAYTAQIRAGNAGAGALNSFSAIENTCFQCHSDGLGTNPTSALRPPPAITGTPPTALTATEGVPNIAADFSRTYRMPITTADQGTNTTGNLVEVHDITDVNGSESQVALGYNTPANRHVECTDCHNPHRVIKSATFINSNLEAGDTTRRTHVPARGATGGLGNIAGGALRGAWGVEPSYAGVSTATRWMSAAEISTITFTVKSGDPGNAAALPVGKPGSETATYLTREYQLCFKCHSSYANGPTGAALEFPLLKAAANGRGGTPSATNGMTRYTNVAAEFAAIATDTGAATGGASTNTHQGEGTNAGTACGGANCTPVSETWDTNTPLASTLNHRSWHPVVFPTGRDGLERGSATFDNIRPPFNVAAKIGKQTMQCSDCHGQATSWTDGAGPNLAQAQGPHGSDSPFLLKGGWGTGTVLGDLTTNTTDVCANCHIGTSSTQSGYNGVHDSGGNMSGARCTRCHIAVPHGWKNKAFLVNKRCVGTEGGQATNCVALASAFGSDLNVAPYYFGARLYFATWRRSRDTGYGSETTTCSGSGDMTNCTIP